MRELGLGPALCALGFVSGLLGVFVHGYLRKPTIMSGEDERASSASFAWEKISMHLVVYAVWAFGFGAAVWRGVPREMIDPRFEFERHWPVWQETEWIYLSVYFVPFFMPWLTKDRRAL